MKQEPSSVMMAMLLVVGVLADGMALAESARTGSDDPPECCFVNSRYAGVCVVQPSEDETCVSVLEYLNHPSSSGKSYCGFTEIRGGWKEVACQEEAASRRSSIPVQIPDRVGCGPVKDNPSDQTQEEADSECRK